MNANVQSNNKFLTGVRTGLTQHNSSILPQNKPITHHNSSIIPQNMPFFNAVGNLIGVGSKPAVHQKKQGISVGASLQGLANGSHIKTTGGISHSQPALYETIEQFAHQMSQFYNSDPTHMIRGLNIKEVFDCATTEEQMCQEYCHNVEHEKAKVSDVIDNFQKEVIGMCDQIKHDLSTKIELTFHEYQSEFGTFQRDLHNYIEQAKVVMVNEQHRLGSELQAYGMNYQGHDPVEDEIQIFNLQNIQAKSIQETFCKIKELRSQYTLDRQAKRLQLSLHNGANNIVDFNELNHYMNGLSKNLQNDFHKTFTEFEIQSCMVDHHVELNHLDDKTHHQKPRESHSSNQNAMNIFSESLVKHQGKQVRHSEVPRQKSQKSQKQVRYSEVHGQQAHSQKNLFGGLLKGVKGQGGSSVERKQKNSSSPHHNPLNNFAQSLSNVNRPHTMATSEVLNHHLPAQVKNYYQSSVGDSRRVITNHGTANNTSSSMGKNVHGSSIPKKINYQDATGALIHSEYENGHQDFGKQHLTSQLGHTGHVSHTQHVGSSNQGDGERLSELRAILKGHK